MPELPEVETTRRGISPHIVNKTISKVVIHERKLRWPVSRGLNKNCSNYKILAVDRRAKYLLLKIQPGHVIIHLGMSGSMRIVPNHIQPKKHDHVDFVFDKHTLRFHDPRKFGCILWTSKDPLHHKLLVTLGPEPLDDGFNGEYLRKKAYNRKVSIKNFIMNSHTVVGIGNIYASEALFLSGIHPQRAANRISQVRYNLLANNIKLVLNSAIKRGGTTLRDFVREDGKPGYFANKLNVYNKKGSPCPVCGKPISSKVIGQRSSFYCAQCQR